MARVRLVHWKAQEAAVLIEVLLRSHHQVEHDELFRPALMKNWRESPPDAFVIDLSRLPSHGREIAVALRQSPRTRFVPIVFCADTAKRGVAEKVSAVRAILPDAAYCDLSNLAITLDHALTSPPPEPVNAPLKSPVKPPAMMDRYQDRTAAQKLGILPSSTVTLLDPPANVLRILGDLPPAVEILEEWSPQARVILCFLHAPHSVCHILSDVRRYAAAAKLWILWRKGGSAARGDVTERLVRESALDLGLVDYKICSVDATWTAMLFARSKK